MTKDLHTKHKYEAEKFMACLADVLMSVEALDVDEISEGLSIIVPAGQYLLNYHGVAQQLWLSSPTTGAHHFDYQDSGWVCTRTHQPLLNVLGQELAAFGCSLKGFPLTCS